MFFAFTVIWGSLTDLFGFGDGDNIVWGTSTGRVAPQQSTAAILE